MIRLGKCRIGSISTKIFFEEYVRIYGPSTENNMHEYNHSVINGGFVSWRDSYSFK